MKKVFSLLLVMAMLLTMGMLAFAEGEKTVVNVASLKGPTSMGLVKLIQEDKEGTSTNDYNFEVVGAPDEITGKIVTGDLDIALVPANLASVLYNNSQGKVQVAAINTLGVLYVVEAGNTVASVADLAGKTVLSTGKGTTPEYAFNYVLSKNEIDPQTGIAVEYKSEATEVAAALAEGGATLAVLPQPFVTTALMKNENLRVALSLSEEWDKVSTESALVTGVVIINSEFAKANPQAVKDFLEEYKASTGYVNANPDEAGIWIAQLEIAPAAVASKAIPECNIVFIDGEEMKTKLGGYLDALFQQNPEAVGGQLPDDAFYYMG